MDVLKRGLIVSCQAVKGEPLYGYGIMHLFAKAAKAGGACGIRALCEDVDSIKDEVGDLPVIGLVKQCYPDSEIYITPKKSDIDKLLAVKCDVVCMDATLRPRPNGETLEELYNYARIKTDRPLMADIATLEDAVNADKLGFDYISTTMRGYTADTRTSQLPDIEFIAQCKKYIKHAKLIAEGGVFEVNHMEQISKINPYAVVVGSAITRPMVITQRLNGALKLHD